MLDLVGNPKDLFSHVAAQIIMEIKLYAIKILSEPVYKVSSCNI